jgi:hypothetical protein
VRGFADDALLPEVAEDSYGLDGLAQTHIISEYSIDVVIM